MLDANTVKLSTDLIHLISLDTHLKKVASTGSGEWAGPCPFCGGEDRFRVQEQAPPGKLPEGQRWMCRQCNPKWSDVIGYVMKRDNLGFKEALKRLAPEMDRSPATTYQPPTSLEVNRAEWVSTALMFVEECVDHLWGVDGKNARAYLHWRCLNEDALKRWAIGYNPNEGYGKPEEWGLPPEEKIWIPRGIVIPCQDAAGMHYIKIRRQSGDPKYLNLKGGEHWPFGMSTYLGVNSAFLFEGEFDVVLAHQTGFIGVGYASMPAGQHIKTEYQRFFESVFDVIVQFDNDDPGQQAADELCKLSHFHKADYFPQGKDLTEYAQLGGNVFEWLYRQLLLLKAGWI